MSLHFVLDGYNVINQVASLAEGKLEERRANLIQLIKVHRPQGSLKNRVTVVFDGQPDVGWGEKASSPNVIFTSGESADEKIKRIVEEGEGKKSFVVVTDDRAIRYHVRALGAKVLKVSEFWDKIKASEGKDGQIKKSITGREDRKAISKTLEQKINAEFEGIWLKQKDKK